MGRGSGSGEVGLLGKLIDEFVGAFDAASVVFEKGISIALMTIGLLYFLIPLSVMLGGKAIDSPVLVMSIIGSVVLLLFGAGIQIYFLKIRLSAAEAVAEYSKQRAGVAQATAQTAENKANEDCREFSDVAEAVYDEVARSK